MPARTNRPFSSAWTLALLVLLAILLSPRTSRADDDPGEAPSVPQPPPEEAFPVGEIVGDRVNLRVGPRLDNRPVAQLDRGTLLVIVEQAPVWSQRPEWYGVRVPAGFPVAVSMDYVEPAGPGKLRVRAEGLNLRVHPPEVGRPIPAIFRDHPEVGDLLTVIELEDPPEPTADDESPDAGGGGRRFGGRWAWVIAPESIRAYVSARFVLELDPGPETTRRLEEARARRAEAEERLVSARGAADARSSAVRLMETVGSVQQALFRLRQVGGHDKAPIVSLANQLDEARAACPTATPPVLRLAEALRSDLEREVELRLARHDAAVARALGRKAPAVPSLEPKADVAALRGLIRYEATPGWREDGVYLLWIDGKPAFALRLTVGGDLPHPDFRANADGRAHLLEGALPGERLFGLPVLEVKRIGLPR